MIAVVDYGLGNIAAFLNVYKRLNIEASAARTPADIARATRLILPGVGSFDPAMQRLKASGLAAALSERVLGDGVPLLGVCVGMQMLARTSDEGEEPGLGWIDASVKELAELQDSARLPLPHMGWNEVERAADSPLFEQFPPHPSFYFLHSYYVDCERPDEVVATTGYGREFPCAIRRRNVYGVQFHPEKSHDSGARLLRNFAHC